MNKVTYVDNVTVIGADNLNEIQDAIIDLEENSNSVPTAVRSAILTLFEAGAYAETGLTDEIAVIESWASEVTSLSLSASTLTLNGDTPQTIVATVVPSSASVIWSSSDDTIATVVGGVVTGVSNGSCTITASAGDLSATCAVTVSGFATLESISAVYTQSGTVYDTDSLDSLKADLVVTATYSDSTTETVPSTDYTLSGTLEAGTSTIAVTYHGKGTTFNVTVIHSLYPMENGTHEFTSTNRALTVTNGDHFVYTNSNAQTSGVGGYINICPVSENDASGNSLSNITNPTNTIFTIPANASVVFKVKNIVAERLSSTKFNIEFMNNGTAITGLRTGDKTALGDVTVSTTVAADSPVTNIYIYTTNAYSSFEANIELYVNGERWI